MQRFVLKYLGVAAAIRRCFLCVLSWGLRPPTLTPEAVKPFFDRTLSRGPNQSRMEPAGSGMLCFHRLAIMGLTEEGMQPFHLDGDMVVCNGELYGFRPIRQELSKKYVFRSQSDCEIILPLYREYGLTMFEKLDAEFAMDPLRQPEGQPDRRPGSHRHPPPVLRLSDRRQHRLCQRGQKPRRPVQGGLPLPPGHYYADGKFVRYADLDHGGAVQRRRSGRPCAGQIREKLIAAVDKRLDADAPLGFLLSGGLDSSLVCAISAKLLGKNDPHLRHRHGYWTPSI